MRARTDPACGLRLTATRMGCAEVAMLAASLDGPLLVLGLGAWRDLEAECGSVEAVWRWLQALATTHDRPLGVNLPTGAGASTTMVIAPASWSHARLAAARAAAEPSLAAAFGPVTARRAEPARTS